MTGNLRERLAGWLLLLVWAGVIWTFAGASFDAFNTSRLLAPLLHFLLPDIGPEGLERAHFLVRKSAHLAEYAVLGLVSWRAAAFDLGTLRSALTAAVLVVAMAGADEWRQSLLAERTGALADVWLDTLGGLLGVCVIVLWRRRSQGADRERA
ncbi:MAG: hypothetical protein E2O66_01545 [Deltaproteobacteria bacterium]|nr:MAG: hypothetical protein E2O66_01545 [Deltaproteobacteria bacterium]